MVGLDVPVHPVRGQIVATQTLPHLFTACVSTSGCYLAQKRHGEVIIGSTTGQLGFDVGATAAVTQTLCAGAARAIPALADVGIKRVGLDLVRVRPTNCRFSGRSKASPGT